MKASGHARSKSATGWRPGRLVQFSASNLPRFGFLVLVVVLVLPLLVEAETLAAAGTVSVRVDRSRAIGTSRLALGVTHMQYSLDPWGDPAAVARGKALLRQVAVYQNQHIMGFGADNPMPEPGVYDWESLDRRVALMRETGAIPVLTLCCAPTWMVDPDWQGGTDWSQLERAPLVEHEAAFAALAQQVAQRYPEVKHFLVWNEFKGLWDAEANTWDAPRYTRLYNQIYRAIKQVRPDARIGGPYLVIEGTGSQRGHWATAEPITRRNLEVLDYWLRHAEGADFIVLDRSVTDYHDPHRYSEAELLALTDRFATVMEAVRARTDLPIWLAEDYFVGSSDWQFQAVGLASMLYHEVVGGAAVSLRWQPQGIAGGAYGGNDQNLFSDTRQAGGGQPFPNFEVYKLFHDHFGPGTPLYRVTVSAPEVEVLASDSHTLLINKQPEPVVVDLDGTLVTLDRYEVRVLSIAQEASVKTRQLFIPTSVNRNLRD